MTGEEAKQALLDGSAVVWQHPIDGPLVYKEIRAIRYTKYKGRITVGLEMYDRNKNSVSVAPMKEVELYKE